MKLLPTSLFAVAAVLAPATFILPQQASAHCQIPCGIYHDSARVAAMLEDAQTVAKACTLVGELAGKTDAQSQQQLVRWVTNKEAHAQKVIATISDYFLTQRVKPSQDDYAERLQKHHAVILAAMKAKQNADGSYAEALTEAIQALRAYYPEHMH
ncbi:superoxide dismutase, Ni [Coraliomargarita parva]|uniref:superoxide dismutase, Ni n=1 Tax=Coraliomargarita parva TaxID=3014050 RepID=UPI0022B59AD4|nr:superoxide dismutase, Ni [Coraliomargarita parva]